MSLLQEVQLLQQKRFTKRRRSQESVDTSRDAGVRCTENSPAPNAPANAGNCITRSSVANTVQPRPSSVDRLFGNREAAFYGRTRLSVVEISIQRFLAGVRLRLQQPDQPVKIFPRQAEACCYADQHDAARLFSCEISAHNGTRSYLVASYERFWRHYSQIDAGCRHHYEIIREQSPCHLYFDLEFNRGENVCSNGNKMTDNLLAAIDAAAEQQFGIQLGTCDAENVTELDSTTDVKWSRHLIVRMPGAAFATAKDCGAFVSSVLESTGSSFIVCQKGGGTTSFVDCSVYSRNRAFRLYLSSKAGKSAVLTPSGRMSSIEGDTQRAIFMRALICNVDSCSRLLYCKRRAPCNDPSSRGTSSYITSRTAVPRPTSAIGQVWQQPPCSHPGVDTFFSRLPAPDGVCGQIRSWAAVAKDVLLVSMRGTRWCGNVGRHHKSNGIYYVIDLAGGTWWQKCYDFDCRSYRSEMRPLPPQICSEAARVSANEGVLAGDIWTDEQILEAVAAEQAAMLHFQSSSAINGTDTSHISGTGNE